MARVRFVMDDTEFDVDDGARLIDVARGESSIPFGCTNGVCGTCISKIVSGMENLSEMERREENTLEMFGAKDGEHRLVCQCSIDEGLVEIDSP